MLYRKLGKTNLDVGVIGHIGISSHNPLVALKAVESGIIDVLMFSINAAYDLEKAETDIYDLMEFKDLDKNDWTIDPARQALYSACEALGVGITVMKPLGAGTLLNADRSPFKKAMTVTQCCHYCLTRPHKYRRIIMTQSISIIAVVLLIIILGIIIFATNFVIKETLMSKRKSNDVMKDELSTVFAIDYKTYEALPKEEVYVKSHDNLTLKGYYHNVYPSSKKVVIINHGYTANHFVTYQFTDVLLKKDIMFC